MGPNEKVLYLTFDEGGLETYVKEIVDVLDKNNVKATFFLCRKFIEENAELIKQMAETGHTIANHTSHHLNMPSLATRENFEKYIQEIEEVEQTYYQITGKNMEKVYRDPKGEWSYRDLQIMKDLGYKTYFYSADYLDYKEGMHCITLDAYKTGVVKDMDEGNVQFKLRQERIKENNRNKYKEQLVRHFEEAFKFRLITYYTKLREFSLDDIMRKLGDLGYLDERFNSDELYIYEEEARRLLARRLCAISYKNDIEILMEQKLIDPSRITYNLNVR